MADIKFLVVVDSVKGTVAIKELDKNITGLGKSSQKATPGIAGMWKQMTVGVASAYGAIRVFKKITSTLEDVIQKASQQEAVERQLEARLRSTGEAAGLTKDELLAMAAGLQKVTDYGDETIIGAENLLLTFTKIGRNVFPQALETVLDMSTALGQDLKSSAIQVGKALQDPILGVTALRRVGVNFNEQQAEQIRLLVESGKIFEAQKFILQELSTEFGGSARASIDTYQGSTKSLRNTMGDLKEELGNVVIENEGLKESIQNMNETIRNAIDAGYIEEWVVQFKKYSKIAILTNPYLLALTVQAKAMGVAIDELTEKVERDADAKRIDATINAALLEVKRQLVDGIKDETEAIDPLCKELGVSADYFSKNAMAARLYQIQLLELKLVMDQWKTPELIKSPQELMKDMDFTGLGDEFLYEWQAFEAGFEEQQNAYQKKLLESAGIHYDVTEQQIAQIKELSEFEQMALAAMVAAYEDGFAGVISVIEKWAIGEIIKKVMIALPFPANLLAPAGAIAFVKGAFATIKKFDKGGIVMSPVLGMIGERRPEAILPLEDLPRLVQQVSHTSNFGPMRIVIQNTVIVGPQKNYQETVKIVNLAGQKGDLKIPTKVLVR